ncbi:unnamed protein product [Mucor fragilis]
MRLESLLPKSKCYSDVEPDPLDPNFYCRVCKTTKKSLKFHRVHCREVHNMTLAPIIKVYANPDAVIDEKDPNFHCAKCDKGYHTRQNYLNHLRKVHKLQPKTKFDIAHPDKEIDIYHPDRLCAQCDRVFSTNSTFRLHLQRKHNIIVSAEELTQASKSNRLQPSLCAQ